MSQLVDKLSEGEHRVEIVLRPERNLTALREAINRGFVHVRFPDTRGGTELTVKINPAASRTDTADLEAGSGSLTLSGNLTLDYVPVECIARVELPGLSGTGRLVRLHS